MSLTDDLRQFAVVHRRHGHGDLQGQRRRTDSGYDLRLRCTCGQHYYAFVTPEIAAPGLPAQAERN